jgi:hypothetical protein
MSKRLVAVLAAAPVVAAGLMLLGPGRADAVPCTVTSSGYGAGVQPAGARVCYQVLGLPGYVDVTTYPGPYGIGVEQDVQLPGNAPVHLREYAATSPEITGLTYGTGGVSGDPNVPYEICFQSVCLTGDPISGVGQVAVTQSTSGTVASTPSTGSTGGTCAAGSCVSGRLATGSGSETVTVQPGVATGPVTRSAGPGSHCIVAFDSGSCSL